MIGRILAAAVVSTLAFMDGAAAQYGGGPRGCVMYEHNGFGGRSISIRPGGAVSFRGGEFWNDRVSSTRAARGCTLVAYEHSGMRGRSIEMRGRTPQLGRWNDRISSAECSCRRGQGWYERSSHPDRGDFHGKGPYGDPFGSDDDFGDPFN